MDASDPSISVVICAYTEKRWDDICEAVDSVRHQDQAAQIVLVIDYNEALLNRAYKTFADIKVVPNHYERGLSGARNTGIEVSNGQLIGFLDDDAVAAPDWLSSLVEACKGQDILGATATVEPRWLGSRPGWLPDEFLWTIGCSYRGLPTKREEVRNLFGGAMLMKRSVFEAVGGFNSLIGRKGSFPLSCEDTELCIRATQSLPAYRFLLEPKAVIYHKINTDRLTWKYFRVRCFAEGLSKAFLAGIVHKRGVLNTERSYVLHTLSIGFMRGLFDIVRLKPSGFEKSSAILLGLSYACSGYAFGKVQTLFGYVKERNAPLHLHLTSPAMTRDPEAT